MLIARYYSTLSDGIIGCNDDFAGRKLTMKIKLKSSFFLWAEYNEIKRDLRIFRQGGIIYTIHGASPEKFDMLKQKPNDATVIYLLTKDA